MTDNPFAKALAEGEAPAPSPSPQPEAEAPAPEADGSFDLDAALESVPDDVDHLAPLDEEDEAAVAAAEPVEKDGKKREVVSKETFLRRVRSLTAKRRTAEASLDSAQKEAKRAKDQVQQLMGVFGKKKPESWQYDSDFLDAWEELAAEDPAAKSVAERVISRMKTKGGTKTVSDTKNDTTPTAPAQPQAEAAEKTELLVVTERVVNRDARKVFGETLAQAGVDEKFAKAITAAGMQKLTIAQRAELDGNGVIAFTKKYLKENDLSSKDILKQAAAPPTKDSKPSTSGGAQGRTAPATKDDAAPADSAPKFKTPEEYFESRKNALRGFAKDLGLS